MNSKILIVEDEMIEAMGFQQSLKSFGYDVVGIASTGEDALKKVADLGPDLVLMDVVLKGEMDGIEAAAKIKEDFDIPVIFITAHPEESTLNRAKLTLPNSYLIKPVNRTDLKISVELALYKHMMDDKLKESEDKHRSIVENIIDAYFRTDTEGRIIMASPSAAQMLGFASAQEMIGLKAASLYNSREDQQTVIENLNQHGKIENKEFKLMRKDGSKFWVSVNAQYVYDDQGIIQGTEAFVRDISATKKAEFKLIENEEKYRKLFEEALDGIALADIHTGELIEVNKSLAQLVGRERSELIGQHHSILHPPERLKGKFAKTFLGHLDGEGQVLEDQIITKTGEIKDVEIKCNKIKLQNLELMQGIFHDITEHKKAEEALKESEKKYRGLVDNSLVAVYETNLDGEILFANEAMAKIFDYESVEDLKSQKINQVYKKAADREKLIEKLRKQGKVTQYEMQGISKSGKTLTGLVNAQLIGDKISGMIMDITERKKSEEALRKSEERYRLIFDESIDAIYIHDLQGNFIDANQTALQMLGYTKDDIKNLSFTSLISEDQLPEAFKTIEEIKKNSCQSGISQYKLRKKDGSHIYVETKSSLVSFPGNKNLIQGIARDITDRKKAEAILQQVMDVAPYGAHHYELNPDGDLIFIGANKSADKILGIDNSQFIGKTIEEAFPKLMETELPRCYKRVAQYGETYTNYQSEYDEQGISGVYEVQAIQTGKNKMTVFFRDVTEARKAEKLLKSSLKEKELLLKEIHHRVKNNLQIISSLLDLQVAYVDEEESVNVLKESQNRVLSMAMIHEMIYQSEDLSHINFSDYTRNLISHLFNSYKVKPNIKSQINVDELFFNIETSIPLGLIISELVSNSLKHAFPDERTGKITININHRDDEYRLIISDDGVGLPEELDFPKTESTLGLRLVNSLVNQLDGTIELEQTQGTRYTIKFKELKYKKRI